MGKLSAEKLAEIRRWFLWAPSIQRAFDHIDALETENARLQRWHDWSTQFHCERCGPVSPKMVTTKKTCAVCEFAGLYDNSVVRSKHPYVAHLEAENARLRERLEKAEDALYRSYANYDNWHREQYMVVTDDNPVPLIIDWGYERDLAEDGLPPHKRDRTAYRATATDEEAGG